MPLKTEARGTSSLLRGRVFWDRHTGSCRVHGPSERWRRYGLQSPCGDGNFVDRRRRNRRHIGSLNEGYADGAPSIRHRRNLGDFQHDGRRPTIREQSLPVEHTRFELVINLKTAKALGIECHRRRSPSPTRYRLTEIMQSSATAATHTPLPVWVKTRPPLLRSRVSFCQLRTCRRDWSVGKWLLFLQNIVHERELSQSSKLYEIPPD